MSLADRLRRAAAGVAEALGPRRSGVELVRLNPPEAPPAPASAPPRRALPAPAWPLCPRCRTRHEPRPHPAGSGGLRAAYGQPVAGWAEAGRPTPLGRSAGADVSSLLRDSTGAWTWGRRRPLLTDPRERER